MRAALNHTGFRANAKMMESAQLDKTAGSKVSAASKETIMEKIDARNSEQHEKAAKDREAAEDTNLFVMIGTIVGAAIAACVAVAATVFTGGLAGVALVALVAALPTLAGAAVGNAAGRGLGSLATNGDKEDASAAGHRAGTIDLERKEELNVMHRSGQDRLDRGREQEKQAQQNITKLLDRKIS